MGRKAADLSGIRFGKLVVMERYKTIGRDSLWLCHCDCGGTKIAPATALRLGRIPSCGCMKDGKSLTPEYQVWTNMKTRCYNHKSASFVNYGARGIKVCSAWLNSFEAFLADMGARPTSLHQIDRIDNSGNYEPKNCRWVLPEVNLKNTRSNRLLSFNGETKCLSEWAREKGIAITTIWYRLSAGWSVDRALHDPVK